MTQMQASKHVYYINFFKYNLLLHKFIVARMTLDKNRNVSTERLFIVAALIFLSHQIKLPKLGLDQIWLMVVKLGQAFIWKH